MKSICSPCVFVCFTDQPVGHRAEDNGWKSAQCENIREQLAQEVHGQSVITAYILMSVQEVREEEQFSTNILIYIYIR